MQAKGRDMVTGLPRIITLTSDDVTDAVQNELQGIVDAVKEVLHNTPPELSADVMEKGMVLSGGSSQLRNLDRLLAEATGVPAFVADNPQMCVARGRGSRSRTSTAISAAFSRRSGPKNGDPRAPSPEIVLSAHVFVRLRRFPLPGIPRLIRFRTA